MPEPIAARYMNEPTKVCVPRRPIRTGDELKLITWTDARIEQEIQLQEPQVEDRMPLPPLLPRLRRACSKSFGKLHRVPYLEKSQHLGRFPKVSFMSSHWFHFRYPLESRLCSMTMWRK
jgi:hypothetical protein